MPSKVQTPTQQKVINFIPHEGQKYVLTTKKRFIFAMGGKRGGKTTIGCYWAYLGMQVPKTQGLIGANTHDQLNQSVLTKFFEIFPELHQFYYKQDKMLLLPNGSKVFFRSLEQPQNLEGLNLHWAWIDEADGMSRNTWGILRGRVATTLGKILATSTIYPASWIYDEVYKNKDNDYEIITWESIKNPSFPRSEWKKLQREMDPVDFEREFQSHFVFSAGRVFDQILKYGIIDNYPDNSIPLATVFGVDFGVNDPSVVLVATYNSDGNWYIVDEMYAPNLQIQDVNRAIEWFITKYGRPLVTPLDFEDGMAYTSIVKSCNPIKADKSLFVGISFVRDLIYQQKVYVFKKCVNVIRELGLYSFDRGKTSVPEDKYNHAMDALRYIIFTAHPMVEHRSAAQTPEEEMTPFWRLKKEQGIYLGNGLLATRPSEGFYVDDEGRVNNRQRYELE